MIPITDAISDYFAIKILFLAASLFFALIYNQKLQRNVIDLLVLLFYIYCFISILWSDMNLKNITLQFGFITSYILTYFIIRLTRFTPSFTIFQLLIVIICEMAIMEYLNDGMKSNNGGYIVGHVSIAMMPFIGFLSGEKKGFKKYLMLRLVSLVVLCTYVWLTGIRFVGLQLAAFAPAKPRLYLMMGFGAVLLMYYFTQHYVGTSLYTLLLGYRIAEPLFVLNDVMNNGAFKLIFGNGIGKDFFEVTMGSKGQIVHSGIFHNFYLTILYNLGFFGLFFLLFVFLFKLKQNPHISIWIVFVMLMICIDSHRDGVWLVFALLAFKQNIHHSQT